MTSLYLHAPSRTRRNPRWRRWLLVLIGLAALFLAPALAHAQGVAANSVSSADVTAPGAPQHVTAVRQAGGVRVEWSAAPQFNVLGYTVYRASAEIGPFAALNLSLVTGTGYDDNALPVGASRLWYYVTASDENHHLSDPSDTVMVQLDETVTVHSIWKIETGYPNPSSLSSRVTVPLVVPPTHSEGGTLVITDNAGHRVWQTSLGSLSPGRQLLNWDGRNEAGRIAAPGVYHVLVIAGGERASSRLVRVP